MRWTRHYGPLLLPTYIISYYTTGKVPFPTTLPFNEIKVPDELHRQMFGLILNNTYSMAI